MGAIPAWVTPLRTTAPASVQEWDLCSTVDDTIECSFGTSHPSNQVVTRAAQGP